MLDPIPGVTADHPRSLQELEAFPVDVDTPLLLVTSRLHSKRTALCFRRSGYTNFRVVVDYEAGQSESLVARRGRRSDLDGFEPSGRRYADPLNRLRWGIDELLTVARELAAIGVYKYQGQA